MQIIGNDYLDEQVGGETTGSASFAAGLLHGASVNLYQGNISITRNTPLSAFTAQVATYNGYGAESITWNAPTRADDGSIEVIGTLPLFTMSGSSTPNMIGGLFITMAGSGSLGFAGAFDAPIPMADAFSVISVQIRWRPSTGGLVAYLS